MQNKLITIGLVLLTTTICKAQIKYIDINNYHNRPLEFQIELKRSIYENADTNLYEQLRSIYKDTLSLQADFFAYALFMTKVENYSQSYFDVFSCLIDLYPYKNRNMDKTTADFAIKYLLKAMEIGHSQAQEIIKRYSIVKNAKNNQKQINRIRKGEKSRLYLGVNTIK
jgi:hypothetical protein